MLKTFLLMRESVINFNSKLKVQHSMCRGTRAESFAKHSKLHLCVRKFKQVEGFTLVTENVGQELVKKKKERKIVGLVLFHFKNMW